jgi:hypothetical protein
MRIATSFQVYFLFPFFKILKVKHKKRRSRLAWWGNYEKMFTCVYPGRPNSNWEVGLTMHEKLRAHNLNLIPQISWPKKKKLFYHNTYSEFLISIFVTSLDLYQKVSEWLMLPEIAYPYCVFVLLNRPRVWRLEFRNISLAPEARQNLNYKIHISEFFSMSWCFS